MKRTFNFDLLHLPALALVAALLVCAAADAREPCLGAADGRSRLDAVARDATPADACLVAGGRQGRA